MTRRGNVKKVIRGQPFAVIAVNTVANTKLFL